MVSLLINLAAFVAIPTIATPLDQHVSLTNSLVFNGSDASGTLSLPSIDTDEKHSTIPRLEQRLSGTRIISPGTNGYFHLINEPDFGVPLLGIKVGETHLHLVPCLKHPVTYVYGNEQDSPSYEPRDYVPKKDKFVAENKYPTPDGRRGSVYRERFEIIGDPAKNPISPKKQIVADEFLIQVLPRSVDPDPASLDHKHIQGVFGLGCDETGFPPFFGAVKNRLSSNDIVLKFRKDGNNFIGIGQVNTDDDTRSKKKGLKIKVKCMDGALSTTISGYILGDLKSRQYRDTVKDYSIGFDLMEPYTFLPHELLWEQIYHYGNPDGEKVKFNRDYGIHFPCDYKHTRDVRLRVGERVFDVMKGKNFGGAGVRIPPDALSAKIHIPNYTVDGQEMCWSYFQSDKVNGESSSFGRTFWQLFKQSTLRYGLDPTLSITPFEPRSEEA